MSEISQIAVCQSPISLEIGDSISLDIEEDNSSEAVTLPSCVLLKLGSREKKLLHLRAYIERDFWAAELKWTFFVAACQSSRYDMVLRPFPPDFVSVDNFKNIGKLLTIIEEVSPLGFLLQQIHKSYMCREVHNDVIDLLYWLYILLKDPCLESLNKDTFNFVLSRAPCTIPVKSPDYIFQVVNPINSPAEIQWEHCSQELTTMFAYHGNKLENFHCIIHNGLQKHLHKQKHRKGKEICLSPELVSKYALGASEHQHEFSCIALCELLNHEAYVRLEQPTNLFGRRSRVKDSRGIEMDISANKRYIVTNEDMVRVRYLMVYRKPYGDTDSVTSLFSWFRSHKVAAFILLGMFVTCLVICSDSWFR